ncbi:MAG: DUF6458 family protein, partial [Actinomycetes bacterium]
MGFGLSILLIAVGAILTFAVSVTTNGFNINTIGIILMIVGALGFIAALVVNSMGGGGGLGRGRRRTRMVEEDTYDAPPPPSSRRRRVVRRDVYD